MLWGQAQIHGPTDSMLLCPEQSQTSPKSTSEIKTVLPADVAEIVWLVKLAAVAGSLQTTFTRGIATTSTRSGQVCSPVRR